MTQTESDPQATTLGNLGALLGPTLSVPRKRPDASESVADGEDYACLNCHDGGFIRLEERSSVGAKDFGRVVPCPECSGVMVAMGIPGIFQEASFATFNIRRNPKMAEAVRAVRAVADGNKPFCLLAGDVGVGKTHLACAALRFNKLTKPGRFWQFGDLLEHMRHFMFTRDDNLRRDEYQLTREYQTLPGLLVLDDVGAADPDTPFRDRVLYALVNHRYTEQMPTILTTNDVARLDERVRSRCIENSVSCEGEDQRGKK
jgi:DNA replication protein DnaC